MEDETNTEKALVPYTGFFRHTESKNSCIPTPYSTLTLTIPENWQNLKANLVWKHLLSKKYGKGNESLDESRMFGIDEIPKETTLGIAKENRLLKNDLADNKCLDSGRCSPSKDSPVVSDSDMKSTDTCSTKLPNAHCSKHETGLPLISDNQKDNLTPLLESVNENVSIELDVGDKCELFTSENITNYSEVASIEKNILPSKALDTPLSNSVEVITGCQTLGNSVEKSENIQNPSTDKDLENLVPSPYSECEPNLFGTSEVHFGYEITRSSSEINSTTKTIPVCNVTARKSNVEKANREYPLISATQMYNSALQDDEDDMVTVSPFQKPLYPYPDTFQMTQAYEMALQDPDDEEQTQIIQSAKPKVTVWPWRSSQSNIPVLTRKPSVVIEEPGPQCELYLLANEVGDVKESPVTADHAEFTGQEGKIEKNKCNVIYCYFLSIVYRGFVPPRRVATTHAGTSEKPTPTKCPIIDASQDTEDYSTLCPLVNLPKISRTLPSRRQRRLGLSRPYFSNKNK